MLRYNKSRLKRRGRQRRGFPKVKITSGLDKFYTKAWVTNTLPSGKGGTLKMLKRYGNLVRVRYYKNSEGEIRKTVELEV